MSHSEVEGTTIFYVAGWTKITIFFLILIPFIIYCLRIMWNDRDQQYVQKRRPTLIIMMILLNIYIAFS